MVRGQIQQMIAQVLQETYTIKQNAEDIYVDHPTVESFGDYTSNIALMLIKHLPKEQKQSPLEIAKKIAEKLSEKDKGGLFEKIEAVSPGFINFTLSLSYLHTFLRSKFKENIQEVQIKTTEKFLIEHTGPNTNKPLHIGHVRNAILGTAILNILHEAGYNVIAANINNDRGIHIIKSMYGYLRYGVVAPHDSKDTSNLWSYKEALTNWSSNPSAWHTPQTLKKKPDHLVGHYYILGNNAYEDSEKKAEESGVSHPSDPHNQMQQMLIDWEAEEENIRKLWKQNNDWFYEGMHQTLRDYNFHSPNDSSKFFDKEWYESELYKKGKDIIIEKIGNGVIQECEDGHVEAVLEKYNLPNIVLLRKNKTSLYIIQDIELFRQRIKEDHTDKLMILTDAGQNLRFQQLFAICESLGIAKREQLLHLGYGTVRLPEGKMSSRKGTVIQADELLQDVKEKAKEKINEEHNVYTEDEKEDISRQVSLAAIKYGILKYNALSNITFDIEKSIAFEGDTGPYIQYTHARAASILNKFKTQNPEGEEILKTIYNAEKLQEHLSEEERVLINHLYKFSDVIIKSALSYSPNYLCEYLYNLAQKFNFFYAEKQILSEKNTSIQKERLLITLKTRETINKGLALLGIESPDKM